MGQRIPKTVLKKHLRRANGAAEEAPSRELSSAEKPKKKTARQSSAPRKTVRKKLGSPAPPPETFPPVNGFQIIEDWLAEKGLTPFAFQEECWHAHGAGQSGIVNAPTGFGKTFAVFLAVVIDWINRHPDYQHRTDNGLQLLWITPLRALGADIARAMEVALEELGIPWRVGIRNGDTSSAQRQAQKKAIPEILVTTPESMHLIFSAPGYPELFESLTCVAIDEWHELLGSKRGVQIELVLAHLKTIRAEKSEPGAVATGHTSETRIGMARPVAIAPGSDAAIQSKSLSAATPHVAASPLRIWGISATIGNLEEALLVLLGERHDGVLIRAKEQKEIAIHTVLPDVVERLPWAGHLGIRLMDKVLPIVKASGSTLLFTNTRSHSERWYQALLDAAPELAGTIALHHSAVDGETRAWIEEQLHIGSLQVVVCTASLDLGVDFRPVDTVIQVGSPKGIARFLQRAGRAGHSPGEVSHIHFVPTHSLEIVEAAALTKAYERGTVEKRTPILLAYDVLVQYAVTRASGEGFREAELFDEVRTAHCFADLQRDEWEWILRFITGGGETLGGYDEYHRVAEVDGVYRILNRKTAVRHRMHIGTIVGNSAMRVKFLGGGFVGTIEESFISRLKPGDVFVLAGRKLELVNVKDMDAIVRRSDAKRAIVPSWQGGRLSLSSNMGDVLRETFTEVTDKKERNELLHFLEPLWALQRRRSKIPGKGETLVELIDTREGHHLFAYPFEGRLVHQAMAALLAYRIAQRMPITFSIAMNDYGFELVSEQPIPVTEDDIAELFSTERLYPDLQRSINDAEMGRRKFRDIAVIAGLIFQGLPGAQKKQRHLQASSGMIYDVLQESEPDNLLLAQAYNEVLTQEVELDRLHAALERVGRGRIVVTRPKDLTPFCFPIMVDSLREQISSEKLEDRIRRMQEQATKWA